MEHIRSFAVRAETLGYDSLWLQERIIGDFTMLEPVTLLSYVAGITTKLKLGTSVILLPLRNPLQLAKAYSSLDVMSGGRAVLGVGLGGGHLGSHEDVFGYSREGRVTRFTEAVQIMKLGAEGQFSRPLLELQRYLHGTQTAAEAALADHLRRAP